MVLGVEWPTGLVPSDVSAGLSTYPDKAPDPVLPPRVKQAEGRVDDMLGDDKGGSSARSPFPDHWPLIQTVARPCSPLDSSTPVDIRLVPADGRLIPDEDVSRIEAIIANEDGTRSTDCLRGDTTQSFIDRVQEVRPRNPLLPRRALIAFSLIDYITSIFHLPLSGFG